MTEYRQEPPFAVQIELTEGCNLRCPFCALNGIRGKENNFKFMTEKTLARVMKQVVDAGWNPRIEFAMHGEPSMHPNVADMIALARECAPRLQLMMTSNGGGLLRKPGAAENIRALFDAGLNVLALDDYDGVKLVEKVIQALHDDAEVFEYLEREHNIEIYNYPQEPAGNPHMRRKRNARVITIIEDISRAKEGTHSLLNNHAGVGSPPNDRGMGKRCAKPFRELSVRWDGNVAVCCNDFRGVYKCGNVATDGLDNVWNGPAMQAARKKLYHGMRDFGPCKGCDALSYRVGFLPDKLGKQSLAKPSKRDLEVIEKAIAGGPYTKPVLRPWELKDGAVSKKAKGKD